MRSNKAGALLAVLPIVALAFLAGATFWLVERNTVTGEDRPERVRRHVPDYYIEGFSVTALSASGATRYRLRADRVVHYEDDDTLEILQPSVRAFQEGRPPITLRADRGTTNPEGTIVDLLGNARLVRESDPGSSPDRPPAPMMEALSDHFSVLLYDDVITSEVPVMLWHGDSRITADKLRFFNVTREVQLTGNVRGLLVPPPATP